MLIFRVLINGETNFIQLYLRTITKKKTLHNRPIRLN